MPSFKFTKLPKKVLGVFAVAKLLRASLFADVMPLLPEANAATFISRIQSVAPSEEGEWAVRIGTGSILSLPIFQNASFWQKDEAAFQVAAFFSERIGRHQADREWQTAACRALLQHVEHYKKWCEQQLDRLQEEPDVPPIGNGGHGAASTSDAIKRLRTRQGIVLCFEADAYLILGKPKSACALFNQNSNPPKILPKRAVSRWLRALCEPEQVPSEPEEIGKIIAKHGDAANWKKFSSFLKRLSASAKTSDEKEEIEARREMIEEALKLSHPKAKGTSSILGKKKRYVQVTGN